jgi:ATP-dependent DNA helicase RecG
LVLSPLDPVDRLSGIGAKARASLEEHGVHNLLDLIWTPPLGWDDLRAPITLAEAITKSPERCAFAAMVKSSSILPMRGRRTVRVVLEGPGGCTVHAFWFFMAHGILGIAKAGAQVLVVGKITSAEARKPARMAHPEIFADSEETRVVRPRYPKLGVGAAVVKKAIATALDELDGEAAMIDPVPPAIVERESMLPAWPLLRSVHQGAPSTEEKRAFIERLAWAEAFTRTWERLEVEEGLGAAPAPVLPSKKTQAKALFDALGFEPTKDQRVACDEVAQDLAKTTPMRRLLLGDVGTGKTAVALLAIAQCVAAKRQAVVLAPTSVLADQYMRAMKPLETATGARIALIAAGMNAADRQASETMLARGEVDVAVGTHALLSEGVAVPNLALVVVDEQQRLGVGQRLALITKTKGERPHLLTLSATPIPRTLSLVLRGELAVSTLRELPFGFQTSIPTGLASKKTDLPAIVNGAKEAIERGERVFWIVPRVGDEDDEDDGDDLATAAARAKALRAEVGSKRVAVVHGRLRAKEKNDAMNAFRSGASPILVATTVVEVGIDVPEATLMIIEDADRFGLAQLHQLRGRVGRGGRPGACVLLVNANLASGGGTATATADVRQRRLALMTKLTTGEDIARADLELRGAGDLGGTRQHGVEEELVYLDPSMAEHAWLERIEEDARRARKADPGLSAPEHHILGASLRRLRRSLALRMEAG